MTRRLARSTEAQLDFVALGTSGHRALHARTGLVQAAAAMGARRIGIELMEVRVRALCSWRCASLGPLTRGV
jgi:hypothetical protein